MLAKSLKTTGASGLGARRVPSGVGAGLDGVGGVGWVGMGPLLYISALCCLNGPVAACVPPSDGAVIRRHHRIVVKSGRKWGRNKAAAEIPQPRGGHAVGKYGTFLWITSKILMFRLARQQHLMPWSRYRPHLLHRGREVILMTCVKTLGG